MLPNIKAFKDNKGIALAMAILLVCVLVPIIVSFLWVSTQFNRASNSDRQINTANTYANNVLVDLMRQFSQGYYKDHYSAAFLDKAQSAYSKGFSDISYVSDPVNHFVYVKASGKYGQDSANPLFGKTLNATIKFVSPWTEFGNYMDGDFGIEANNIVYGGKAAFIGDLIFTGPGPAAPPLAQNNKFSGGPVFVKKNVICFSATNIIDGDLYYGGSITGPVSPTVNGTAYNFCPEIDYPILDQTAYEAVANVIYTDPGKITFQVVGGVGEYIYHNDSDGSDTTVTIPAGGYVIVAKDANLVLTGRLRGRVTIVAIDTAFGTNFGKLEIEEFLVYNHGMDADGLFHAKSHTSLAVIAQNAIVCYSASIVNATHNMCGVYNISPMSSVLVNNGIIYDGVNLPGVWQTWRLYGTRNAGSGWAGNPLCTNPLIVSKYNPGSYNGCGRRYFYDPDLVNFPPPFLPEKPRLVSYHFSKQ